MNQQMKEIQQLAPGTYRYFCIPHEGAAMFGEVVVKPAPIGPWRVVSGLIESQMNSGPFCSADTQADRTLSAGRLTKPHIKQK